jgi:hypothetical protein
VPTATADAAKLQAHEKAAAGNLLQSSLLLQANSSLVIRTGK